MLAGQNGGGHAISPPSISGHDANHGSEARTPKISQLGLGKPPQSNNHHASRDKTQDGRPRSSSRDAARRRRERSRNDRRDDKYRGGRPGNGTRDDKHRRCRAGKEGQEDHPQEASPGPGPDGPRRGTIGSTSADRHCLQHLVQFVVGRRSRGQGALKVTCERPLQYRER